MVNIATLAETPILNEYETGARLRSLGLCFLSEDELLGIDGCVVYIIEGHVRQRLRKPEQPITPAFMVANSLGFERAEHGFASMLLDGQADFYAILRKTGEIIPAGGANFHRESYRVNTSHFLRADERIVAFPNG